ncbi:MAG: hypothetical protein COA36_03765 [Desulfotalea sp.]|nr:MAG: hypothetical protein COA36_03765 [Desulfotalea sp.]
MPKATIYPPGDKMIKAIKEYSEELSVQGEGEQNRILQKIILKYDLSPKECTFMEKNFKK